MATTKLAKESATQCLNLMMNGVGQCPGKPLYPIDAHFQESLFDKAKLEAYALKGHLKVCTGASVKTVTEESITKFAKSYSASVSASGKYGFPCGAAVSGSLKVDFKSEHKEERSMKFCQVRKKAQYASMKLPKQLLRSKLRDLLNEEAKELIDAVNSPADAAEVIEAFGPVYMHTAIFGAILVCSTKSQSSEFSTAKNLETAMEAEIEYLTASAKVGAKFNMGSNTGNKKTSMTFEVSAVGGDPSKILEGDESAWIKSAGQNLNIIDLELSPISELAKKGSSAEKILLKQIEVTALGLLGKFENSVTKKKSKVLKGKYLIWNKDGNRHANKLLHVRGDGYLQLYGPMTADYRKDGNRHFKIEPYKVIGGDQTYVVWNDDGSRHPNKYMHVRADGYLQVYGALSSAMRNDRNRHFVIKEYKMIGGQMTYLIWNNDGDRHKNKYVHVTGDGYAQCYGPMTADYTKDCNRHFVIERYPKA